MASMMEETGSKRIGKDGTGSSGRTRKEKGGEKREKNAV